MMCPANRATVAAGCRAGLPKAGGPPVPGGVPPSAERGHQLLSDCQRPRDTICSVGVNDVIRHGATLPANSLARVDVTQLY